MEDTRTNPNAVTGKASEHAPIFGLNYLEEHEFDLSEVVGCFGVSSTDGDMAYPATYTCPGDDWDGFGHVP
ncbi:MAG TPA: herpeto-tandem family RiPP [Herpetosiphonaceae bacterium]